MPFTPEQKAGFDKLERSGYLPALRARAMSHAVSFFWHNHEGHICHNGTVSLVDTGTKLLAITAEHVYREYKADFDAGKVYACQFGSVVVEPDRMLIDSDRRLDVATFEMYEVAVSSNSRVYRAPAWPPPAPKTGEWMFYGGYPKAYRVERDTTVENGMQTLFGRIQDVSDTCAVFDLKFEELHWPLHEGENINEALGGMSGGPVFRHIEEQRPGQLKARLEFVGTVMEHSDAFQMLRTRAATVIAADGTLIRP